MFGALILFFDIFLPYLSNWYTWGFWPNLSMLAVRPPFQRLSAYGIASTPYVVLLYSIINENCRRRIRICYRPTTRYQVYCLAYRAHFRGFQAHISCSFFAVGLFFKQTATSNKEQCLLANQMPSRNLNLQIRGWRSLRLWQYGLKALLFRKQ